jgi:hypothetical protein
MPARFISERRGSGKKAVGLWNELQLLRLMFPNYRRHIKEHDLHSVEEFFQALSKRGDALN